MSNAQDTGLAVKTALQAYAQTLSNLPDHRMLEALDFLKKLEKMSEDVKKTLSTRAIERVKAQGTQVSDAGSMEATVEGQTWRIIPVGKTRPEVKKVAALLIAKGHHDVNRFFTSETEVVCTKNDLDILVNSLGLLTEEEAKTCLPKRSYRIEIDEAEE